MCRRVRRNKTSGKRKYLIFNIYRGHNFHLGNMLWEVVELKKRENSNVEQTTTQLNRCSSFLQEDYKSLTQTTSAQLSLSSCYEKTTFLLTESIKKNALALLIPGYGEFKKEPITQRHVARSALLAKSLFSCLACAYFLHFFSFFFNTHAHKS